jgi:hypothetical protein
MRFLWNPRLPGVALSHRVAFHIQETGAGGIDAEAIMKRVLCHILVTMVPDRGLREACDALRHIAEYYGQEENRVPALPEAKRVKARVGQKSVRSEFHVEE